MTRLSCRTAITARFSPKAARNRRRQGITNIRSGGLLPRKHSPDGATAHIRLNGPATHLSTSEGWNRSTEDVDGYHHHPSSWPCKNRATRRTSSGSRLHVVSSCSCNSRTTDLYKYSPDAVPPIHVVSYHVATDKPPAQNGDKFRSNFSDNLQPVAAHGKKARDTLLVDCHCGNGCSIKPAPLCNYEISGGPIGRAVVRRKCSAGSVLPLWEGLHQPCLHWSLVLSSCTHSVEQTIAACRLRSCQSDLIQATAKSWNFNWIYHRR